jgi:hypothetical protein
MRKVNWAFGSRWICKAVVLAIALWCAFWYFCSPVVVLHYDARAKDPVVYFYDDNNWISKKRIDPGAAARYFTDMFPDSESWIDVSLPFSSRDSVTLKLPFSRVDVYINADTKIERTVIRHGFFDRFSAPKSDWAAE